MLHNCSELGVGRIAIDYKFSGLRDADNKVSRFILELLALCIGEVRNFCVDRKRASIVSFEVLRYKDVVMTHLPCILISPDLLHAYEHDLELLHLMQDDVELLAILNAFSGRSK